MPKPEARNQKSASGLHSFSEVRLLPGAKTMLEVDGLAERLISHYVGAIPGRYFLMQLPAPKEVDRCAFYGCLSPSSLATVKIFHDGAIFAFRTQIDRYVSSPCPLLFLRYPAAVERFELRKHPRIATRLPAAAFRGEKESRGMILDVSVSGCRVVIPAGGLDQPEIDDAVDLECRFFGFQGERRARCLVKNIEGSTGVQTLSLKFHDMPDEASAAVARYVEATLPFL